MRTSEAEFKRVVHHKAGHTLEFDHEHMRSDIVKLIDRDKAISFFDEDQGWTPEEVEEQVLTPLAKKSIMGTEEADPVSIMCYQLPAVIMKNGKPIKGGKDINPRDHAFAASLYPKKSRTATPPPFDLKDISQPPAEPGSRELPDAATPLGPGTELRPPRRTAVWETYSSSWLWMSFGRTVMRRAAVRHQNSPRCSQATAAPASHR